jgi:hypothetical protein
VKVRSCRLLISIVAALSVLALPAAAGAATLHDQLNNASPDGTESSSGEAADDFAVPGGLSWSVETVLAGTYGTDAPDTFNVRFYADSGGVPGAEVASRSNVPVSSHAPEVLNLGTPVLLSAGTYWVSVQGTDQWLWGNRSVAYGSPAAYSGGIPTGGCVADLPEWYIRARDCTMTGGPDQMFRLDGTAVPLPVPPPPTTPTQTATKKKCKKGFVRKKVNGKRKCVRKKKR